MYLAFIAILYYKIKFIYDCKKKQLEVRKKEEASKKEENKISLEEQLATEKDKNLRLFAEFDNFRKRTAKERIELFGTASQDIMTSLLPILDNFERAFKANKPEENDGYFFNL